jgi:antitoxin YefM
MTMLSELQFTEARKEFSSLYDEVYHSYKPVIIKRKQSEEIMLLRPDLQKMLLTGYSLKPEVLHETDGSITLALDQLEIYVNEGSKENAVQALISDLKAYAVDYMNRSALFLNAPNRAGHFPYVLRILLCNDDNEIRGLLEL